MLEDKSVRIIDFEKGSIVTERDLRLIAREETEIEVMLNELASGRCGALKKDRDD